MIDFFKKLKNIANFGGITYLKIEQIHKDKILENKNIVITGGTSGIGYEIAKKAIDLGAKVLVTGRNIEKLKKVQKDLKCEIIEWDIADINSTHNKIQECISIFNGKIDCFINNAGIFIDTGLFECTVNDYEKVIKTDLTGLYFATKEIVIECFQKNKKGNIINIASNRGIIGDDGPYGLAKASVIHFTRGLARELLDKNIRVNAISPGMTASNINGVNDSDNMVLPQII